MAERNARIRLGVVPEGDPAKPLRDMANAGKKAKEAVDGVTKAARNLGPPAKDATTKLSDMFLATMKKGQDAKVRVDELTAAVKKLGITTQQAQQMARQMGREFQLSTQQINQALCAAGRAPIAGGGRLDVGAHVGRLGTAVLGGMGVMGISSRLRGAFSTSVDDDIRREIAERGTGTERVSSAFAELPILSNIADISTHSSRREAAAATRRTDASVAARASHARDTRTMAEDRMREDSIAEAARVRRQLREDRDANLGATGAARGRSAQGLATPAGERFLAEAESLVDLRRGIDRTGTGGMEAVRIREQMEVAQAQRQAAEQRAARAGAAARADTAAANPGERLDRLTPGRMADVITARQRVAAALERQLQEVEAGRDADARAAGLAQDHARLMANLLRSRAQQLQAAADQARTAVTGATEAFGMQTNEQQHETLDAARAFRRGGIGALTPEQLGNLRGTGLFNDEIANQATARAQRSGVGELINLSGAADRAANLQRQADQVRVQAEVTLAFNEAQIAAALTRAMQTWDQRIEAIAVRVTNARRAAEAAARHGFGGPAGGG